MAVGKDPTKILTSLSECRTLSPDGMPILANLQLCDSVQDLKSPIEQRRSTRESIETDPGPTSKRLSQWESLTPRDVPEEMRLPKKPAANRIAVAHSSTLESSRFQRFIRRMESAGPKIILDRLREDWEHLTGDVADEEVRNESEGVRQCADPGKVALEKQLWLLTGFELQNLGRGQKAPAPKCDTGRILELYGNLCEFNPFHCMCCAMSNVFRQRRYISRRLCTQLKLYTF